MFRDSCPVTSDVIFPEVGKFYFGGTNDVLHSSAPLVTRITPHWTQEDGTTSQDPGAQGRALGPRASDALTPEPTCFPLYHTETDGKTTAFSRLQEHGMCFVILTGFARTQWKGKNDMPTLSYLGHDTIRNVAVSIFFNLAYVLYMMNYLWGCFDSRQADCGPLLKASGVVTFCC